jgi:D-tyrosyl-tRNA(Tyr) deacylase
MKLLIQRVEKASVEVDSSIVSAIDIGLVVFIGVTHNDTYENCIWLAKKLVNLRIFENEGKFNCSLLDIKGEALIVSQFTLYGDCNTGRRPSFTQAASPDFANKLYELFIKEVKATSISVKTGIFAAKMKVNLINDGPVTLMLER